jgi:hypothetical protein
MANRLWNELGPIAATYEELQGIPRLDQAFEQRPWNLDPDALTVRTILQCLALLYLNFADLCDRQLKHTLPDNIARFHQHTAWHLSLLRYGLSLIEHALSISPPADAVPCPTGPAFSRYFEGYSEVCQAYIRHLDHHPPASNDISNCMLTNPHAAVAHNLKNIYLFQQILLSRLSILRVDHRYKEGWDAILNTAHLDAVFAEPRLIGDTYFSQFRLLHQIPELLARCAHERTALSLTDTESLSIVHILRLRDQYRLVTESTQTMLHLMTPCEYHQIRLNLGVTSGSMSNQLRQCFLKSDVSAIEIAGRSLIEKSPRSSEAHFLKTLLDQIRLEALSWRDYHLGFPRNVLGGFGTKSLIGSDAVNVALAWRNEEIRHGSLHRYADAAVDFMSGKAPLEHSKRLDDRLLQITAEVTKDVFPHVENRTGIYRPGKA